MKTDGIVNAAKYQDISSENLGASDGGLDLTIDRGLNKMMSHIDTEMVQDTQNRMFRNDHVTVSTILTPNELDTHRPSSVLLHTLLEAV